MRTLLLALTATLGLISLPTSLVAQEKLASNQAIEDGADFFSAEAEQKAASTIAELRRKHDVDVRVETFESVPAKDLDRVKAMTSRERGEYFANWLKELARGEKAQGIFILACREPSHLRVGVSKALYARGFTESRRDQVSQRMLAAFKEKEYDRGLSAALTAVGENAEGLKAAAAAPVGKKSNNWARERGAGGGAAPAPAGQGYGSWMGLACLAIGGLMVVMLIMSVVGSLFRNRGGYAGAPGGGPGYGGGPGPGGYGGGYGGGGWGGGGGSIFGGLLSGLGGAMLGNWIYDRWSGHGGQVGGSPMGPTDTMAGGGGMVDDSRNYQDFGSSGGDFGGGDYGGGGDFGGGGGDFGGGDSGGGDF